MLMGTDIYMLAERRTKGKWHLVTGDVFMSPYDKWARTDIPYSERNYDTFAILADVRNGIGFAGCLTGECFNPISEPKGLPVDADPKTLERLFPEGYAHSYLSLKELKEYDWNQRHKTHGCVSEEEYADTIAKGLHPTQWCSSVIGGDTEVISERDMKKLIKGKLERKEGVKYYCECWFPAMTYADASGSFYYRTIPALEELIPEGGSEEDVRIIFNFDC